MYRNLQANAVASLPRNDDESSNFLIVLLVISTSFDNSHRLRIFSVVAISISFLPIAFWLGPQHLEHLYWVSHTLGLFEKWTKAQYLSPFKFILCMNPIACFCSVKELCAVDATH